MPDVVEFCPPCKIILDNGARAKAMIECMQHSIHLGAAAGLVPPEELRKAFATKADELALAAQNLANWYPK